MNPLAPVSSLRFAGTGPQGKPNVLLLTSAQQVDCRFENLKRDPSLTVVGQVSSVKDVPQAIQQYHPDVLVIGTRVDDDPHENDSVAEHIQAAKYQDLSAAGQVKTLLTGLTTPLGLVALKFLPQADVSRVPQQDATPFHKATWVSLYASAEEVRKAIKGVDPYPKQKVLLVTPKLSDKCKNASLVEDVISRSERLDMVKGTPEEDLGALLQKHNPTVVVMPEQASYRPLLDWLGQSLDTPKRVYIRTHEALPKVFDSWNQRSRHHIQATSPNFSDTLVDHILAPQNARN